MTTLTEYLLSIYEKNPHLTKLIEDVEFLKTFKRLLVSRVENEESLYFNPSEIKSLSVPCKMLALELFICLSKEEEVFEKHYTLVCPSCQTLRREKEIDKLFVCTDSNCVPLVGEALSTLILEQVYYQFSISKKIQPLILEEVNKKKEKGVERYGE